MTRSLLLFATALSLMFGPAPRARAGATPAEQCAAAKQKAAGKKTAAKIACYAAATSKGVVVDQDCLTKADMKFMAAFTKAETKGGCVTSGDAASVEAMVNDCVQGIVNAEPVASTTTTTIPCLGRGALCR
jgi:hypothetical protein